MGLSLFVSKERRGRTGILSHCRSQWVGGEGAVCSTSMGRSTDLLNQRFLATTTLSCIHQQQVSDQRAPVRTGTSEGWNRKETGQRGKSPRGSEIKHSGQAWRDKK